MLFCNLFIYHLPTSVILSVNKDSFWNLCWSGKRALFSTLTIFVLSRHAFVKNGMQCSDCNHFLTDFFLSKTRNRSPFPNGKCYEGERLCMWYISLKSDRTKLRQAFIFPVKNYPETELRKYQVCFILICQKLGCAYFKNTVWMLNKWNCISGSYSQWKL